MTRSAQSPARRGGAAGTVVAWAIVIPVTALVVGLRMVPSGPGAPELGIERALLELQARYAVGVAALFGRESAGPALPEEGPLEADSLRAAVLAGELSGPGAALSILRPSREGSADPGAPGAPGLRGILIRLYRDYARGAADAPSVPPDERARLAAELGWIGRLALAPPGTAGERREQVLATARRTVYAVSGGLAAGALVALAGLVVLGRFLVRLARGRGSRFDPTPRHGGVYAEAFALWLVLFLLASLAGARWLGPDALASVSLLAFTGSLLALGWPRLRGVAWARLRADLGWTRGAGAGRELAAGLAGYAMGLALVVLALALSALLLGLPGAGPDAPPAPSHPIVQWLAEASGWQRLQLVLLACVAAPIVEETAFRGLLYRHLREATARLRPGAGVLLSAAVSGILFGVLHPQGFPAVPGIVGIGLALAFMREWRGTLLPSILGHAANNAVTLLVLTAVLEV